MATYVIGDVQGCFDELQNLLEKINFNKNFDKLIFIGDVINRGPKSLETIKFIMSLGDSAEMVLGNHELVFLATSYNFLPDSRKKNTFYDIIDSPELNNIVNWLCNQKILINYDSYLITHAGIPHIWSPKKAKKRAIELESVLKNEESRKLFLSNLFSIEQSFWHKELISVKRWLCIANYFTRMRAINKKGKLNLNFCSSVDKLSKEWKPWFNFKNKKLKDNQKIIFGHWAALQGKTNNKQFIATDTGCSWGNKLSCFHIEKEEIISVNAIKQKKIKKG